MLSENAIDNLVQPIVNRQEAINTYVISKIARTVRDIGKLSPRDINRMKLLVEYGADIREMNNTLAELSGLQVRDIKSMIKTVAIDTHLDAKPLYDYRHKSFIPYERNPKLQQFVRIIGDRTAGTYENISHSRATGFLIRDLKHPNTLKFQSIDGTYQSVIDEAIQSVQSGVDYRTAMRRTLRQLADSGIRRLTWDSGYTQRLDTAVRRNILEGVRAIQQAIEDQHGEEIGADGKELSVHINCALDHEPFQGHQLRNEEWEKLQSSEDFEDVNGEKFTGVERVIGMWNCRHIARSIIVGVSKPLYTPEKLQKFIDDNHNNGITLPNGKKLTRYECTQIQRQMETKIRYAKDNQIACEQAGDTEGAKIAREKVKALTQSYKEFSKRCGMPIHRDRMSIIDYNLTNYR